MVLFLTLDSLVAAVRQFFKVVLFLTLERAKSGTETSSPASIYLYIDGCVYIYVL